MEIKLKGTRMVRNYNLAMKKFYEQNEKRIVRDYNLALKKWKREGTYFDVNEFYRLRSMYQETEYFKKIVKAHYAKRTKRRTDAGFTQACKNKVKTRDNFKCQECGRKSSRFKYYKGLDVHHIDGDPTNNCLDNLITLCRSCHNQYTLKQ